MGTNRIDVYLSTQVIVLKLFEINAVLRTAGRADTASKVRLMKKQKYIDT
jgi:hypothetical protein